MRFADDTTLLGSASLDLWISATAPDVDLQVTITEVRPDGQETFVQQGWLRASHRAARPDAVLRASPLPDPSGGRRRAAATRSTPFRYGSRSSRSVTCSEPGPHLRAWVEAPTFLPQLWAFTPTPAPGLVTVLHDADHPSRLVLPRVPNDPERIATLPGCGTLIHQPCRTNPIPSAASASGGPTPAAVATTTTIAPAAGPTSGPLPATGGGAPGVLTAAPAAAGLGLLALRRQAAP